MVALTLLNIFAFFTSDWNSYKVMLEKTNETSIMHLEPFWQWVAISVKGNIYLFRAFIFVPYYIILFLYLMLFVSKENRFLVIFLYIIFIAHGAAGRQGLSIVLFYFAFMVLQKKNLYKIIALPLLIATFFLHRGTIIFMPALLLYSITPSKKIIILSITGTLIACIWFKFFFAEFIQYYFPDFAYLSYMTSNITTISPSGSRRLAYTYMVIVPLLITFIFFLLIKSFKFNLSIIGKKYRNFLFYGFLFLCILYSTDFTRSVMDRYLISMLVFPVIFLVSEILDRKSRNAKFFKISVLSLMLAYFILDNINITAILGI
jgi:hypothetical protein